MAGLKDSNNIKLFSLVSAALLVCSWLQFGTLSKHELTDFLLFGAYSTLFSAVVVMLTHVMPSALKHKIVFTRFKDELPASRLNVICKKDPRIILSEVESKWPEVISDITTPHTRNGLWYKLIYKPVRDKPEVLHAHQNFLLYRDVCSSLLIIGLLIAGYDICRYWQNIETLSVAKNVYFSLTTFIILALFSARNSGERFVLTTVAAHEL
ncbi:MAG: hypothetical protein ACI832_001992 [Rheinheimera aquimaris]|uniref:hypothetical protein n=1 Tax=Rheinheimera aquimaris TaxID=412437 RepID=UPI0039E34BF0